MTNSMIMQSNSVKLTMMTTMISRWGKITRWNSIAWLDSPQLKLYFLYSKLLQWWNQIKFCHPRSPWKNNFLTTTANTNLSMMKQNRFLDQLKSRPEQLNKMYFLRKSHHKSKSKSFLYLTKTLLFKGGLNYKNVPNLTSKHCFKTKLWSWTETNYFTM